MIRSLSEIEAHKLKIFAGLIVAAAVFGVCEPAAAYIGPGAGFAFVTSFFVLFASIGLAFFILLTAPVRLIVRAMRRRGKRARGKYDRVIVLGLDGMDPGLTGQMMDAGDLPNFKRLAESGYFSPLKTTCPAMSPVAWSSFTTGVSPARHNIFDFLMPERRTYFPKLSSSEILPPKKSIKIGGLTIPIGKPVMRLLRKGVPFWRTLSDHGVFSTILRVPITFPPEPFGGHLLSAMCTPDLRGTQGAFTLFTSAPEKTDIYEGGERERVEVKSNSVSSVITGPENSLRGGGAMKIPFAVSWKQGADSAMLRIGKIKINLKRGAFSEWVSLSFKAAAVIKVGGAVRFYLKSTDPVFELYMTPINIDPGNPALPISHPFIYSMFLAKSIGTFSTLGLAEDTWALNERILDEDAFLEQCWLNHKEREDMFFLAIDRTRRGAVVCVFDATDRIQHMFWRYHEPCERQPRENADKYKDTITNLYKEMDELLGRTMKKLRPKDVLFVMSDHGFKAFRRGVDLNAWLEKEGYLFRKPDAAGDKWLRDVDWSRTKAYAIGLSGIYLNIKGREAKGIVDPAQAAALRDEIASKLEGLKDPDTGETAVTSAIIPHRTMNGPYLDNAPDVAAGYNIGYRASWDCAVGKIASAVIEDNTKSWSGDHCIDPALVPGIFFTNVKPADSRVPSIIDIAPSVLTLLGVPAPAHMEGKSIF